MNTSLVCERAVSAEREQPIQELHSKRATKITHVMGFMKGMLTSTASATKFSSSRSMGRLYLDLTYSGLAAYKQATRPPRGVIPTRSPIPRTATVVG